MVMVQIHSGLLIQLKLKTLI
uniref:Uncharacterized protein n=1 Tax=Vitis vinifera TaxID=29760 RepID=F6HJS4_VITVI